MSLRKLAEAPAPITGLVCHEGVLVVSIATGQLAYLSQSQSQQQQQLQLLLDTNGGPRGLAVDSRSGDLFFTDAVRKAVVKLELPNTQPVGSATQAAASNKKAGSNNEEAPSSMPALWNALKSENNNSSSSSGASAWQATQLRSFIDSFLEAPLKGPHGIAFDARGEVYVTDSGAFGETGLCNPHGSVLRTIANCQQVVPLAATGLAYPAGVACHGKTGAVFVCELATNRLLRFVPRVAASNNQQAPQPGVTSATGLASSSSNSLSSMFGSVFHQFAGGFGPIDVAVDEENDMVFVAKFDFASAHPVSSSASSASSGEEGQQQQAEGEGQKSFGEVVALSYKTGEEHGRFTVPGTEVTGVAVDSASKLLYISEGRTLYCVSYQHE